MKTEQDLIDAGKAAAIEGLRLFHLDVRDPSAPALAAKDAEALRWREIIDDIFRAAGWGADTPYPGNRVGREWCGFFAAKCWREAGMDPRWLAAFLAGTLRLVSWGGYRSWRHYKNPPPKAGDPRRLVAKLGRASLPADLPFVVREGDIVVVGDGTPAEGEHITIALGGVTAAGGIMTVSGNGGGNGPDGKHREGIVIREYKIGGPGRVVLYVYRPALTDISSRQ